MHISYRFLLTLFLCSPTLLITTPAHAARKVCVKANGKAVVKRKCRTVKGEIQLELSSLVSALQGPEGAQGPQGPQGIQGEEGPEGSSGISGFERLETLHSSTVGAGLSRAVFSPECPDGKAIISGSCMTNTLSMNLTSSTRWSGATGNRWRCDWYNWTISPVPADLSAEVVCAYIDS